MLSESFKYLNYSTQLSFSTAILFIWPLTPELFQGPESQAHWACHMPICLESAPLADHTTLSVITTKKTKNRPQRVVIGILNIKTEVKVWNGKGQAKLWFDAYAKVASMLLC